MFFLIVFFTVYENFFQLKGCLLRSALLRLRKFCSDADVIFVCILGIFFSKYFLHFVQGNEILLDLNF